MTQPSRLKNYIGKMRGGERALHPTNWADALTGAIGGFISICTLLLLTYYTDAQWLMASLGASCVLVFGAWNAPFSQPLNVIAGHIISGVIALTMYTIFGGTALSISLAVGLTIFTMMLTRTVHPPAGGNPIVIMLAGYGWNYLLTPILVGAIIVVIYGVLINNLRQNRKYPLYWI